MTYAIPCEHPADRSPHQGGPSYFPPEREAEITAYQVNPPIPTRAFDWVAFREGSDEGDPYGRGPTREAAIADLLEQEECA
jgi:hypothetical protein